MYDLFSPRSSLSLTFSLFSSLICVNILNCIFRVAFCVYCSCCVRILSLSLCYCHYALLVDTGTKETSKWTATLRWTCQSDQEMVDGWNICIRNLTWQQNDYDYHLKTTELDGGAFTL